MVVNSPLLAKDNLPLQAEGQDNFPPLAEGQGNVPTLAAGLLGSLFGSDLESCSHLLVYRL